MLYIVHDTVLVHIQNNKVLFVKDRTVYNILPLVGAICCSIYSLQYSTENLATSLDFHMKTQSM